MLCPDENHPHMIDLGLPSGTKWACCNIGASLPEEYGGYYSWGETEEKDYYNWEDYTYKSYYGDCDYIGDDIANTQYDVAHVKWGGSWCMPSSNQFGEFLFNCTEELITLNGKNGVLITGPNGSSIFLPAAGGRYEDFLIDEGSVYEYWTSTFVQGDWAKSYYGYNSTFSYLSNYSYKYARYYGMSVRAVCP